MRSMLPTPSHRAASTAKEKGSAGPVRRRRKTGTLGVIATNQGGKVIKVNKKRVKIVSLLAIILILLCSCSRYNKTQEINRDLYQIIEELNVNIDSDDTLETIIIDTSSTEFARLLIFKNSKLIFSSEDHDIKLQKDFIDIIDEDMLSVSDSNNNKIPEIYLTVCGDGIEPNKLAIIEDLEVLFYESLVNYEFTDLNLDGKMELCGLSNWGGQIMFNCPEFSTYQFETGQYTYSEELTKLYYNKLCSLAEDGLSKEPSCINLEYLISLYAKLGYKDKGIQLIKNNVKLLNNGNDLYDYEFFVRDFEQRLLENGY